MGISPLENDLETSSIKQYVLKQIATKRSPKNGLHESKISPSLMRFLSGNKERLIQVNKGYGLSNKLRLFGVAVLDFVPNSARQKVTYLDKSLTLTVKILYESVVVKIDNCLYVIRDRVGLGIVGPNFEQYMHEQINIGWGGVFIDVGAHVGKYTVLVSKIVGPKGTVIAVEPNPENFKAIKRNIKLNNLSNVVAYNVAAADKTGPLKLFTGDTSACYSVEDRYDKNIVTVQAQKLDEIVNELDHNRVDLVKIDVEGGEYEVLLGLEKTLQIFGPKVIVEVWMKNIDKVANFFDRLGYSIKALSDVSEYDVDTPDYNWCIDVLAVHN